MKQFNKTISKFMDYGGSEGIKVKYRKINLPGSRNESKIIQISWKVVSLIAVHPCSSSDASVLPVSKLAVFL